MKGSNDFVTNVDKESEAFIMAELAREFPDMGLLGEESASARPDERYVWIVNPDVWRSKLRLGDTLASRWWRDWLLTARRWSA